MGDLLRQVRGLVEAVVGDDLAARPLHDDGDGGGEEADDQGDEQDRPGQGPGHLAWIEVARVDAFAQRAVVDGAVAVAVTVSVGCRGVQLCFGVAGVGLLSAGGGCVVASQDGAAFLGRGGRGGRERARSGWGQEQSPLEYIDCPCATRVFPDTVRSMYKGTNSGIASMRLRTRR